MERWFFMCEIKISGEECDALLRLTERIAGAMSRDDGPTKPVECSAARLTSLRCEKCGKEIREGEKYFVREDSIARITLESSGRLSETKESAWTTKMLCMKCHYGNQDILVKDYDRDVDEEEC